MSNIDVDVSVYEWFDSASDGELNHMANKLAKNGYPERGVHSKAGIEASVRRGSKPSLKAAIGDASVAQVVRELKGFDVSLATIVREWTL